MAYGEPTEINDIDLNSQWVSNTTDDEYKYFKSDSYEVEVDEYGDSYSLSQCKVTWSNLLSITFKYMSSNDMGELLVLKLDSEKFTPPTSWDDVYLSTGGTTPGTYNEFTIECDEGEHHIWFCYLKYEDATDEGSSFIGVPKYVSPILDIKQGSELPMEYKFGGVSAEGGKTYNISFNNVILPNGSYIVPSYEDFQKVEKIITYEYVDLGLSVKWAKCNIGASSETEGGTLFQWGETSGISGNLVGKYSDEKYSWATYTHCNDGSARKLRKYNTLSSYGEKPDKITTLESVDDAATQIMGDGWRMPTQTELQELLDNTDHKWTQVSGVNGYKFTSNKEGYQNNSIFIPATSGYINGSVSNVSSIGYVCSSSLNTSNPINAWSLRFNSGDSTINYYGRYFGLSVRGVHN